MNYYLQAFRQYADFSGRASRKEFWMFFLFNCIAVFVLYFIIGIASIMSYSSDGMTGGGLVLPVLLLWLYVLATFIPNLAITVRRLHDAGESGWMILVSLIPIAGAIWLLVLLCKDSIAGIGDYTDNEVYVEQVTTAPNPNLCPNCNSRIDADTIFCENCGNKIK